MQSNGNFAVHLIIDIRRKEAECNSNASKSDRGIKDSGVGMGACKLVGTDSGSENLICESSYVGE
jgi:hypothetical protein